MLGEKWEALICFPFVFFCFFYDEMFFRLVKYIYLLYNFKNPFMNKQQITKKINDLRSHNAADFDFEREVINWIYESFQPKDIIWLSQSFVSVSIEKIKKSLNDFKRDSNKGFSYDEICVIIKNHPECNRSEFFKAFKSTDNPVIYDPQQVFDALLGSLTEPLNLN